MTVEIYVQHGGREAPRRAGLSAEAETCFLFVGQRIWALYSLFYETTDLESLK